MFTTGILVALTLNPSLAASAAVYLVRGRAAFAAIALLGWVVEVAIVLGAAAVVFERTRRTVHHGWYA